MFLISCLLLEYFELLAYYILTFHPRGRRKLFVLASCYGNREKLQSDQSLGPNQFRFQVKRARYLFTGMYPLEVQGSSFLSTRPSFSLRQIALGSRLLKKLNCLVNCIFFLSCGRWQVFFLIPTIDYLLQFLLRQINGCRCEPETDLGPG